MVRKISLGCGDIPCSCRAAFQTVQQRHSNVQDDDIGLQRPGCRHQCSPIGRGAYDFEFSFQQALEGFQQ